VEYRAVSGSPDVGRLATAMHEADLRMAETEDNYPIAWSELEDEAEAGGLPG
jgi:hypothetical protein